MEGQCCAVHSFKKMRGQIHELSTSVHLFLLMMPTANMKDPRESDIHSFAVKMFYVVCVFGILVEEAFCLKAAHNTMRWTETMTVNSHLWPACACWATLFHPSITACSSSKSKDLATPPPSPDNAMWSQSSKSVLGTCQFVSEKSSFQSSPLKEWRWLEHTSVPECEPPSQISTRSRICLLNRPPTRPASYPSWGAREVRSCF